MSSIPKNRLTGKIAIVTASTNGIGFAIARRLAQEDATVIVSSRRQKNVDAAVSKLKTEGLKVHGVVCHVSNAEQRRNLFDKAEKLGGLHILVSNAFLNAAHGGLFSYSEIEWDKMFDVNVKAGFLLAKDSLPLFRKNGGGTIVFLSSVIGFHTYSPSDFYGFPNDINPFGPYAISKTALHGLTKVAAADLAIENIRVNCVAPGGIKTSFLKLITQNQAVYQTLLDKIPFHRLGIPEEVSGTVAFLVSEDAKYITGEIVVVAGGLPSRL